MVDATQQLIPPHHELPVEIVEKVLDLAAQSSPATGRAVSLVNLSAYKIALPHLFTTIKLSRPKDHIGQLLGLIGADEETRRPHPRLGPHPTTIVRNVWLPERSIMVFLLFQKCQNIEHVALDHSTMVALGMMSALSPLRQHVVGKDVHFFVVPSESDTVITLGATSVDVPNVTHIRFSQPRTYEVARRICLPFQQVTHLAVPLDSEDLDDLTPFCNFFAREDLVMLLLIVYEDVLDEEQRRKAVAAFRELHRENPKIFLVERPVCDPSSEWDREISGEDIWQLGEEYTKTLISSK